MALAETAELAVRIGLDDRLTPGLARTNAALGRFGTGLGKAGKGVGTLAGGVVKAGVKLAAFAAGGLTAVAYAAIEVEDAFAGVVKTVNEADLKAAGLTFDDLLRQFRDLATTIPVTAVELAHIGEAAGALGVKAGDITEFTRVVAELGVTTDLTTDAAATALGKVGTILGLTGKKFEDFADTLVNLGNNGASTESEIIAITQRFAAAGKQAGLTTNEILALSSATASLGIQPEAAGGALSRLFSNMATNIALANTQGKAFAQITGKSIKELQSDIDKGKGLQILQATLKQIKGMTATDAAKTLKALGITNTRDRDAILKLAQNYGFLQEQIDTANKSQGALSTEAAKRFDTVKSKLALLRNGFIEAALTIGGDPKDKTSFIGSLGVAAEKLGTFLKDPQVKKQLEDFGRDLGKAIAGVDFQKLFDGIKGAVKTLDPVLKTLLKIADVIAKLPPGVVGAGGGLIVANSLSGGAIGSGIGQIVGGLGEVLSKSLLSKVPIFGKGFVQPVFVTNPGFGGGGGVAAGAAGRSGGVLGAVAKVAIVGIAAGVALELLGVLNEQSAANRQQAEGLTQQTKTFTATGSPDQMLSSLRAIEKYDRDLRDSLTPEAIAYQLNIDGVQDAVKQQIAVLKAGIDVTDFRSQRQIARVADAEQALLTKQDRANSALGRIANKKTRFTANTQVTVSTAVSVRDQGLAARSHVNIARRTGLYVE